MNGPWIPRLRYGSATNSMIVDSARNEESTEGWYMQVSWLGWMIAVEIGGLWLEERWWKRNGGKPQCDE